jgi:hypothetical protein
LGTPGFGGWFFNSRCLVNTIMNMEYLLPAYDAVNQKNGITDLKGPAASIFRVRK